MNPLTFGVGTKLGGRLTVIAVRRVRDCRWPYRVLICRCECGKLKEVRSSNARRYAKLGWSCGCTGYKEKLAGASHHALTALLTIYKRNALTRGLPFRLTREQFLYLVKLDCYYCGQPPTQQIRTKFQRRIEGSFSYNGIDREDNNGGYVLTNCRPCCGPCNRAKLKMSGAEYVAHCIRVVGHSASAPRSIFD